ncbi:hypothetical protein GCM10010532_067010 [Dactylosporangium siamense]|uniref:Replication initiation protein n=1 Tax=Dactylosporangium siamense TaxID=685454 RepID=A0A919PR41_9ACTN|nr:hypothetical protein Dsi01nite_049960 [Dactylosporangium siamense]
MNVPVLVSERTIRKCVRRLARWRDIDPRTVRLAMGKAAEMQRRGVIHFHAIIRLDGVDPDNPDDPGATVPPPAGIDAHDLVAAVELDSLLRERR